MAIGYAGRAAFRRDPGIPTAGGDAMAVDQTIQNVQDALKLSKLRSKLPRSPKVVDIRVEDYVDTDGEDALRVWIIIDEDVDVENTKEQDLSDLMNAVRGRIRELGVERWAYIWFAKPSELNPDVDEE
jgi:hypothetical protein